MKQGYFLIIDPQKNSLRVSTSNDWMKEQILKNSGDVKHHKTIKSLFDEIRDYLKSGGLDA